MTNHLHRNPFRTDRSPSRAAILALAVVGLLTACASGQATTDDPQPLVDDRITVLDNRFDPAHALVSTGATVTWWFDDAGNAHNVVFTDGPSSEVLEAGEWSRTFDEPGEYRYECTLHPGMDGVVEVQAA